MRLLGGGMKFYLMILVKRPILEKGMDFCFSPLTTYTSRLTIEGLRSAFFITSKPKVGPQTSEPEGRSSSVSAPLRVEYAGDCIS
jgi:hypothetical protein